MSQLDEAEVSLVLGGEQVDLGVDGTFDDRNCRCRVSAVAQDRSGKDVDALAADVASALEMRVQDVDRLAHALSCELPILNIGGQACHDLVIQDAFDVFACYGTLAVPVIPDLEHHEAYRVGTEVYHTVQSHRKIHFSKDSQTFILVITILQKPMGMQA